MGTVKDDKGLLPLNNQVQGPYCKLRIEIFLVNLWPKHEVHGP